MLERAWRSYPVVLARIAVRLVFVGPFVAVRVLSRRTPPTSPIPEPPEALRELLEEDEAVRAKLGR